jgi:hypothetical protein
MEHFYDGGVFGYWGRNRRQVCHQCCFAMSLLCVFFTQTSKLKQENREFETFFQTARIDRRAIIARFKLKFSNYI